MALFPLIKSFTKKAGFDERVLNVGAGSNKDNQWFAEQGYSIEAIDPNYKKAQKRKEFLNCL